ncbi:unnamed protein product, partial [Linum tenue]
MKNMSIREYFAAIRRTSNGYVRGTSKYRGVIRSFFTSSSIQL